MKRYLVTFCTAEGPFVEGKDHHELETCIIEAGSQRAANATAHELVQLEHPGNVCSCAHPLDKFVEKNEKRGKTLMKALEKREKTGMITLKNRSIVRVKNTESDRVRGIS